MGDARPADSHQANSSHRPDRPGAARVEFARRWGRLNGSVGGEPVELALI